MNKIVVGIIGLLVGVFFGMRLMHVIIIENGSIVGLTMLVSIVILLLLLVLMEFNVNKTINWPKNKEVE